MSILFSVQKCVFSGETTKIIVPLLGLYDLALKTIFIMLTDVTMSTRYFTMFVNTSF